MIKVLKNIVYITYFLLPLMVALPRVVHAEDAAGHYRIVPEKSKIKFVALKDNLPVEGAFRSFSGDVVLNLEDQSMSSIKAEVDVASLITADKKLAETLLKPEWFNVSAFPKATLESIAITRMPTRENEDREYYYADATLTLMGKSVPVVINFIIENADAGQAVASGRMVVKRSDFGIGIGEWLKTDILDNVVAVSFRIVGKHVE